MYVELEINCGDDNTDRDQQKQSNASHTNQALDQQKGHHQYRFVKAKGNDVNNTKKSKISD